MRVGMCARACVCWFKAMCLFVCTCLCVCLRVYVCAHGEFTLLMPSIRVISFEDNLSSVSEGSASRDSIRLT